MSGRHTVGNDWCQRIPELRKSVEVGAQRADDHGGRDRRPRSGTRRAGEEETSQAVGDYVHGRPNTGAAAMWNLQRSEKWRAERGSSGTLRLLDRARLLRTERRNGTGPRHGPYPKAERPGQ